MLHLDANATKQGARGQSSPETQFAEWAVMEWQLSEGGVDLARKSADVPLLTTGITPGQLASQSVLSILHPFQRRALASAIPVVRGERPCFASFVTCGCISLQLPATVARL